MLKYLTSQWTPVSKSTILGRNASVSKSTIFGRNASFSFVT